MKPLNKPDKRGLAPQLQGHVLTLLLLVFGLSWLCEWPDQGALTQGQESENLRAGVILRPPPRPPMRPIRPVRPPPKRFFPPVMPVTNANRNFQTSSSAGDAGNGPHPEVNTTAPSSTVNSDTNVPGQSIFSLWGFIWRIVLFLFLTLIVGRWISDTSEGFASLVGIVGVIASCVFAYKWAHSEPPPSSSSDSVLEATLPAVHKPVDSNATQPVEIKHPAEEAFDEGRYRDAILIYEGMLYAAERRSTKNADRILYIHWLLGRSYYKLNEHDKALEHFFKRLGTRLEVEGKESLGVAYASGWIGLSYYGKGEYDKALEYHQNALEIRIKKLGEDQS